MTKHQPDFYNKKSKRYISELCVIAVFYLIPVGQLVWNHKDVSKSNSWMIFDTHNISNFFSIECRQLLLYADDGDNGRSGYVLLQFRLRLSLPPSVRIQRLQPLFLEHWLHRFGDDIHIHHLTAGLYAYDEDAQAKSHRGESKWLDTRMLFNSAQSGCPQLCLIPAILTDSEAFRLITASAMLWALV